MSLGPCPTCGRHREAGSAVCPFCDAVSGVRPDTPRDARHTAAVYGTNRLMRFSMVAMVVTILAVIAGLVGVAVWMMKR